jgi:cation diffusion facilitator family transporter
VGILGNGFLSLLQLGFGLWGHSLALVGAGIDTVTDVVTSGVTLFTGRIVERPPDPKHPYGHGRAETIATKLLSFIIFFAGAQLVISTVEHLLSDTPRETPSSLTMAAAAFSILGKIVLAFLKRRAGKKADSSMLIADAKNMSMDVLISASVLAGLFFSITLGMPLVDTLLGLLVGLWIMRIGYGIFRDTNTELMDGLQDREIYRRVCRAVLSVDGAHNPHKMRIRQLNTRYVIDMDIEVDGSLTVFEGHNIAMRVEHRIHSAVPKVYDVNVHVEPIGNLEQEERFGLSQDYLQEEHGKIK